jgi:hypothetical protein
MAHRTVALTAMALLMIGCGGGPGPSPVGVPADFATKALAACQHAQGLVAAQGPFPVANFNPTAPDVTKFPAVATYLRVTATTWETWLSDLKALGEPSTGQGTWDDLLSAVQHHRDLNADQIVAADSGDGPKFASDFDAGKTTQADVLRAATAAGVAACAQVDR